MKYPDGPLAMKAAVIEAMATDGAALPDLTRHKIIETLSQSSSVGCIITAMEALYASRDGLSPVWLTVGGQAAYVVGDNDFHGKAARAETLHQIFRRCLGERSGPPADKDPEAEAEFAPPVVAPPVDEPVVAPEPVQ